MGEKKLKAFNDYKDLIGQKWSDKVELCSYEDSGGLQHPSIVIGQDLSPSQVVKATSNRNALHVVDSARSDFQKELNISALMLSSPDTFFQYPAASVLSPEQASQKKNDEHIIWSYEFSQISEKHQVLSELEQALSEHLSSEGILVELRSIADELFTNAIYNAPFAGEMPKDRRNTSLSMKNGDVGKMFIAIDDSNLVIGCRDPYGSLVPHTFVDRLQRCYDEGVDSVINLKDKGGAGIGTFMMFEASVSTYIGVDAGECTLIMFSLPTGVGQKRIKKMPKNIHLMLTAGEDGHE